MTDKIKGASDIRREQPPSGSEDEIPRMECPKCHSERPDLDGFGWQGQCAICGYCNHPSLTGDVCDICGFVEAPPSPDGLTAQDHDWADKDDPRMAQWPSLRASMTYACCLRCGVVKRADGKNKPCVGKMPRIGLREQPPDGPTERRGSNGERRQRIEALARKVCDRIEKGEISIGRMSEITGLTHQELMMLHAASGGETPPAPTAIERVDEALRMLSFDPPSNNHHERYHAGWRHAMTQAEQVLTTLRAALAASPVAPPDEYRSGSNNVVGAEGPLQIPTVQSLSDPRRRQSPSGSEDYDWRRFCVNHGGFSGPTHKCPTCNATKGTP